MRLIDADEFKNYIRGALDDVKHLYKDNAAWAKEITDSFCMDIDEQPTVEAEPLNELKKYVIEKVGYSTIVVSMTKREAEIIEKFLEWAVIDEEFCITPVEDYVAIDCGGEEE